MKLKKVQTYMSTVNNKQNNISSHFDAYIEIPSRFENIFINVLISFY